MATRVEIINEVSNGTSGDWRLCFQECISHYDDDDSTEDGFRFIWRRPNGNLQPARGQARIPDRTELESLLNLATIAGWY